MGKPQLIQLPNYQNYQNAINVKTSTISWILFPLSLVSTLLKLSIFSRENLYSFHQTKQNQIKRKKKKKKIDLLSNIMLEVTTNFVSARLLQKPIRLTIRPIKKHNSHFINMYWKTCTLLLPLQSCLNNSFSKILF